MFTGIVETTATLLSVEQQGSNRVFEVSSVLVPELHVDQSVSHNGVCLTVTDVKADSYRVTAVDETLRKTNLGDWQVGTRVNLERCMPATGRFDGHIVQGHVDQVGVCEAVQEVGGSWLFDFSYDASLGNITVEKGSICVNGVSLTVFESRSGGFRVTIIPYTYHHTNFAQLSVGDRVNLEFDIVGKYIQRVLKGYTLG
jgi:riboflavin synthase